MDDFEITMGYIKFPHVVRTMTVVFESCNDVHAKDESNS